MIEKTYKIIAVRKDYVEIDIPAAFYMVGTFEEAIEKAKNDDHESEWVSYELGDFSNYINLGEK